MLLYQVFSQLKMKRRKYVNGGCNSFKVSWYVYSSTLKPYAYLQQIAAPCTAMNLLSWAYLAYQRPQARPYLILAALGTGSGTVFAWTFLRAINGALSIRAQKLAGDWEGHFTIPLTYSSKEKRSMDLEKRLSTDELVQKWNRLNLIRSLVLIAGTVVGAAGLAIL
jgi:hypothetical protein